MTQAEETLYQVRTGKSSVRRMPTISEIMEEEPDNFRGRKRAKTAVKQTQRAERKSTRLDVKKARAENIRSKAKSRVILAEQGILQ